MSFENACRDKTEEACERHIYASLSQPFAAGPASSLFVVGCRRCPSCHTYQVPGHSYLLLDHAVRFFSLFFFTSSQQILEDCLLLLAAAVFLYFFVIFYASFSAKVYAPRPDGGCMINRSKKRGNLLLIDWVHKIKVIAVPARLCYY